MSIEFPSPIKNAAAAALLLLASTACARHEAPPLLVVALDGADWEAVRSLAGKGRLPALRSFLAEGASGRMEAVEPLAREMLWTTALTGADPETHGVYDAASDYFLSPPPLSRTPKPRVPYFWKRLPSRARVEVVGFLEGVEGAGIGADVEARAKDILGCESFPSASHARTAADSVAALDARLSEAERRLTGEKWDAAVVFVPGISEMSGAFMEYALPPMPHLPVEEVGRHEETLYRFYEFADRRLGEFLSRVEQDANVLVVSAYGHPGPFGRPCASGENAAHGRAFAWRSPDGFLLARGPGVAAGAVRGAWIYDAAPTALALAGVHAAAPGRALFATAEENKNHVSRQASLRKTPASTMGMPDARAATRALYLLENGMSGAAEALAKSRASGRGKKESAWAILAGRALLARGALREAEEHFWRALETRPDCAPCLLDMADALVRNGEADAAIGVLTKFLEGQPDAALLARLADINFAYGRFPVAFAYYSTAIRACPMLKPAYAGVAESLLRAEQPVEEAMKVFANPSLREETFVHEAAGEIYLRLGDLTAARLSAERALSLTPDSWRAALILGRAERGDGELHEAGRWFRFAREAAPRRPEPSYAFAAFLHDAGKSEEARREMETLVERSPRFVPAALAAGKWALGAGERRRARRFFARALAHDPANQEARVLWEQAS